MSNTDAITVKETIYDGHKFRSRLEARWATFFNALGIEYLYELEAFESEGVSYLPDFYLPKYQKYVEVKGYDEQLKEDSYKIGMNIDYQSTDISDKGLIILGQIPNYEEIRWGRIPYFSYLYWHEGVVCEPCIFYNAVNSKNTYIITGYANIMNQMFSAGDKNIYEQAVFEAGDVVPKEVTTKEKFVNASLYSQDFTKTYLFKAFKRARLARFEHGEYPSNKTIWEEENQLTYERTKKLHDYVLNHLDDSPFN